MTQDVALALVDGRPARVLAVFAHPDDETVCAGGTLARYASAGADVRVVSLTKELYRDGGTAASDLPMRELPLDLEGIGEVSSHYVDVGTLDAAPLTDPSWPQRIGATFAMAGRGIPYAFGRRRRAASAAG